MATQSAPVAPRGSPTLTGIVDSDVHPNFSNGLRDLTDYMSETWQRKLGIGGGAGWSSRFAAASFVLPLDYLYVNTIGGYRQDASDEDMAPGTDPRIRRAPTA